MLLGFRERNNQVRITKDPIHNTAENINLTDFIKTEKIMGHLQDLYQIALQHNNSRAVEYGYNASVAYVVNSLKEKTNYNVHGNILQLFTFLVQYFPVTIWKQVNPSNLSLNSPIQLNYTYQEDFQFMGSFAGNIITTASAFAGMVSNSLLMQSGKFRVRKFGLYGNIRITNCIDFKRKLHFL